MKALIVEWKKERGHIAGYFADLVDYYNNGDLDDIEKMKIVFPQTSFIYHDSKHLIGIEFQGNANETKTVKIRRMPAGKFYSVEHIGAYQHLNEKIDASFDFLIAEGYRPDKKQPLRLLYWNSPDDNPPSKLCTEILIPLR